MRPTLLMHLAALSQLLPPVLGVAAGRLTTAARRWTVVWCLLLVTHDGLARALGSQGRNNLWVGYIFIPVAGAAALWMLSLWQARDTPRLALRVAIPLFVAASVTLSLTVDDPRTFSLFSAPFQSLVLLLAGSWTFVARSLLVPERMVRSDWFWTLSGFILYAGTATALQPLSWFFYTSERTDLVFAAVHAKAAADLVAFAAIAGGMLCPVPPTSSGGSSSPPSSPSGSSSGPSAWRW